MTGKTSERSRIGRMGALARIAQGTVTTRKAREAFDKKFLDQVDPDRVLPEAERAKRVAAARSLHFMRIRQKGQLYKEWEEKNQRGKRSK